MVDMEQIEAPWTIDQVQGLNETQMAPNVHPFTCPNRSDDHGWHGMDKGSLVATVRGWICVYCNYTQKWAYAFMAAPKQDNDWRHSLFS